MRQPLYLVAMYREDLELVIDYLTGCGGPLSDEEEGVRVRRANALANSLYEELTDPITIERMEGDES